LTKGRGLFKIKFKMPKRFFLPIFSFLILFVVSVSPVFAKVVSVESGDYKLEKETVIDDDLFVAAANVTIDGEVKGNLYVGSGSLNISGKVAGSVYAGSGVVSLEKAQIGQDLVVGAGTVQLRETKLGGSLIAGAGSITIDDKSEIGGGLTAGAGVVSINGKVDRGLMVAAGSLGLNGSVNREIQASVENLTIGENAKIGSDLTYLSSKEAVIDAKAQVNGAVKRLTPDTQKVKEAFKVGNLQLGFIGRGINFGFTVWSLFGAILIGILLVYLFRKPLLEISENLTQEPLKIFGIGLLALALFPMVFVLLMLTMIGIPLAFILLLALVLLCFLAKFLVAIIFGAALFDLIEKKDINLYLKMIVGLVAYYVLVSVPFLGWFVRIVVGLLGIGVVIYHLFLKKPAVTPPPAIA